MTLTVETINELDLTPQADAEIAALLMDAFDAGFGERSFYRQRHHLRLLARDGEVLAGHVALLYRVVQANGVLIPIIGLAEVATADTHRGQGIARKLVTRSLDIAKRSQAQFALLFGDPNHYSRYGFRVAPNPLRHLDLWDGKSRGIKTAPDSEFMVAQTGDQVWIDEGEVDLMGHVF
ncbi:GNAT family N-acetyltransferase [Loktanella sp. S4079]|uniref:GNAT family N-acetyltransferase n=1 Tax=Loktanella sp. S4079 TaxID=579483 RepID=UPI0005FA64FF|nr:GNAT family N-acetyltransferase [Loktanella sp. S4079]KJZ21126.1 hypothetical protein TW80_00245 [Loktanella sp. S4079]